MATEAQTLDDVCDFIVDCLHKTAPLQNEGYPSIRTPNIGRGRLILDGVNRVSEAVYQEWTQRAVPVAGDLILAREAPAGNVALIKDGQVVCLGQRTVHLRPDRTKVDPDFLCYYLLTPKQQGMLLAGETGATSKHVNMKDIRRLPLGVLPNLKTQAAAASTIAAYDDLIENNRKRIALLEEAARLLYREWFVHLRFPGHEHVLVVDGVPEGWERTSPNQVVQAHIGGGWGQDEPQGKESEPAYVIRGTDIPPVAAGSFDAVGLRYHSPSALASRALAPYDAIFEVSGGSASQPVARTLLLTGELLSQWDQKVICASFCKRFTFHTSEDAAYFYFHVREHRDRGDVLVFQKESASSLKNFNFEGFMSSYRLLRPPKPLLLSFFEAVDPILRQQTMLGAQVFKLAQARDLLLPRLMNGEIAV